jgi:hypothetical protein
MLHPSVNVRIHRSFLKCLVFIITTFHPSLDPSRTRSSNQNPYIVSGSQVVTRYLTFPGTSGTAQLLLPQDTGTRKHSAMHHTVVCRKAGEKNRGGAERSFASQSFAVTSCYKSPTIASHAQLTVYKGEVVIKVPTSRKGFPVGY